MSYPPQFNIDPADNDERLLDRMGLGRSGKPAASLPDVFDRLPGLARQATELTPDDVPKLSEPVEVEAFAADGHVVIGMTDAKITRIEIDESWLRNQPIHRLVKALIEAANDAIEQANQAALAQLTGLNSSFGDLMRNVTELQGDVHRAYLNDMARVTEPLRYDG